ncbi:MAG: tripartite tricarboxylate transporter substrate-binding protein, partial [Reyranella sp.]|nr:tripartite tricarboxylate transporter substrate-binding protein [Reyranella sp.]
MLRRTFTGALALGAAASIRPAAAPAQTQAQTQAWPTKPLHIVIPYPPGGPSDVSTRIVMDRATQLLGQSVLFDNKAGASGMIGAEYAKNHPVDAHT